MPQNREMSHFVTEATKKTIALDRLFDKFLKNAEAGLEEKIIEIINGVLEENAVSGELVDELHIILDKLEEYVDSKHSLMSELSEPVLDELVAGDKNF